MKHTYMLGLPLLLLLSTPAFADNVDLGIGGHELGLEPLSVGQQKSVGFTLNDDTYITSFSVGVIPQVDPGYIPDGDYNLTVTGPGNDVYFSESWSHGLTLPSERVAHRRTGFGLSSGWG
jgi:hypothetical protein